MQALEFFKLKTLSLNNQFQLNLDNSDFIAYLHCEKTQSNSNILEFKIQDLEFIRFLPIKYSCKMCLKMIF